MRLLVLDRKSVGLYEPEQSDNAYHSLLGWFDHRTSIRSYLAIYRAGAAADLLSKRWCASCVSTAARDSLPDESVHFSVPVSTGVADLVVLWRWRGHELEIHSADDRKERNSEGVVKVGPLA